MAKFVPAMPSFSPGVAPSGNGLPGRVVVGASGATPRGRNRAGRSGLGVGHDCAFPVSSRATSSADLTAPWRRRITSAIRPIHQV
jgi:hypothetical protein